MKTITIQNIALIIISFLLLILFQREFFPTEHNSREDFYNGTVATLVSPHHLREELERGNAKKYLIIDTRQREDYLAGHIITAINIEPTHTMVDEFKEVMQKYPEREVVVYCYTHVCMRGKKIGKTLAENGVYVRELGIGFNEWKNFWREWNYESEWSDIQIEEFIHEGEEPGEVEVKNTPFQESGCSTIPGYEC